MSYISLPCPTVIPVLEPFLDGYSAKISSFSFEARLIEAQLLVKQFSQCFHCYIVIELLFNVLYSNLADFPTTVVQTESVLNWFYFIILIDNLLPESIDYGVNNPVKSSRDFFFCERDQYQLWNSRIFRKHLDCISSCHFIPDAVPDRS